MKRLAVILSAFLVLSLVAVALASPSYQTSFPRTSILDTFNRADQGPPPSGAWVTLVNGHKVCSFNLCGGSDTQGNYSMTAASYGPDSEAYVTLITLPDNEESISIGVRFQSLEVPFYRLEVVRDDINGDSIILYADTELDNYTIELNAGDAIGISAEGDTITAYHYPVGDAWQPVIQVTDSTITDSGHLFLYSTYAGYPNLDDFGGGTIPVILPTPTPTPIVVSPVQVRTDFAESFYLIVGPFGYLVAAAITIMGILLFAVFVVLPPILRRI